MGRPRVHADDSVATNLRLPKETHDALVAHAEARGWSKNRLITEVLTLWTTEFPPPVPCTVNANNGWAS